MSDKKKKKLSTKRRIAGLLSVAAIAYKAAPMSIVVKIIGSITTAVLPIVTTYFAALTTTALADAYMGDKLAGARAITYVIVTAVLGVASVAWSSFEEYVGKLVRYKIDAAVNDRMFEHFLSLDFWQYDDKRTGDLFDKAQQFAKFFGYVFDGLSQIMTQLIVLISGLIAMLLVSWWLGLILLVAVIPGIIIQMKLSKAEIDHWASHIESRRASNMIEGTLLAINSIAELRLYGVIRHLLDKRLKLREMNEKERIDFEKKFIPKQVGADILEAAAEVIALSYIATQVIARAQPIGQFLFVQQIISRAMGGAKSFVSQINRLDEDIANLFDYQDFMELPTGSSRQTKLSHQPEVIDIQNVSFHYPGCEDLVLRDVSLVVHKSQHIAIVGENGAGKSTLIKLILGLYVPVKGKILLDDIDLETVNTDSWHSYLGVLQQEFVKYSFATAKDNVYMGDVSTGPDKQRFESALDRAEARTFMEKLPRGINTYVNQWMEHDDGTSGVDLSGGQWQRLALARNFYRDSPIIILDEPTSAIDALAESRIFKHLFDDKKRTVITISHRLTTVEKADIIYMLADGKLVEQGNHKELVAKKGAYYHMFESQLRDTEK